MDVIMPNGPIREDSDRSPPRIRKEPTSVPIRMRLLNELVKVEVTDDQPSLFCSCAGTLGRDVVVPDATELGAGDSEGVVRTVPDTDLVGRKALGGARTESDVRREIVLDNRGVVKPLSESETLGVLVFIVSAGSCAVALLMDRTRSSSVSEAWDLPSTCSSESSRDG
jgi:hypothetical protein